MKQLERDLWQSTVHQSGILNTHTYFLERRDANVLLYNTGDERDLEAIAELAGSSMPEAIMSCAAPTRALCPDSPSATSSGKPARRAIALKMRGIWLASSLSPSGRPGRRERNRRPFSMSARLRHSRTSASDGRVVSLTEPTRIDVAAPSGTALGARSALHRRQIGVSCTIAR